MIQNGTKSLMPRRGIEYPFRGVPERVTYSAPPATSLQRVGRHRALRWPSFSESSRTLSHASTQSSWSQNNLPANRKHPTIHQKGTLENSSSIRRSTSHYRLPVAIPFASRRRKANRNVSEIISGVSVSIINARKKGQALRYCQGRSRNACPFSSSALLQHRFMWQRGGYRMLRTQWPHRNAFW